jgi:hypothetical protein
MRARTPRLALAAGLLLVAAAAAGARIINSEPDLTAEEIVLSQQNAGLQGLVAAAEAGELFKFGQALVVVDQHLVQDLVRAVVPLEGDVSGDFHVRIEGAEAAFGDGLALLCLHGRASTIGKSASAAMKVYGGLDVFELDPVSGMLRCRVKVFGVETTEADVLGIDRPARRLTEALAAGGLARLLPAIEVPVQIKDNITLPDVRTRRVRIAAADLPVHASVAQVAVYGGKLWVSLALGLDPQ